MGTFHRNTLIEDADVVLHVRGQEMHAHKQVLALCSPVFRAMFEAGILPLTLQGAFLPQYMSL